MKNSTGEGNLLQAEDGEGCYVIKKKNLIRRIQRIHLSKRPTTKHREGRTRMGSSTRAPRLDSSLHTEGCPTQPVTSSCGARGPHPVSLEAASAMAESFSLKTDFLGRLQGTKRGHVSSAAPFTWTSTRLTALRRLLELVRYNLELLLRRSALKRRTGTPKSFTTTAIASQARKELLSTPEAVQIE